MSAEAETGTPTPERARAEALEQKLKLILEGMSDAFVALDREWRFTEANPEAARLLQKSPQELLGRSLWEILPEETRAISEEHLRRAMEERVPVEFECPYPALDVWYEKRCVPIPEGLLVFFKDISQRKRREEALQESQQMLRAVVDTVPVRVFWKDRNSVFRGCNEPFAHDAGLQSPGQLVGKDDFAMAWAEQAELYRKDDQEVMRSGQAKLNYEEPQTGPGGRRLCLRTSKIPLRDAAGHIVGVLGTYEDITERKAAEQALQRSEATLRSFFEHAPMTCGIVELLDDGDILHVFDNPATACFFGTDKTAGRRASGLGATRETIELWRFHYLESARTGQPARFESYHQRAGRPFWLGATVTAIGPGPSGRMRFCYLAEDITARKDFQAELERLVAERTRELEETTEQLNSFCYSVAHDLKAPIRAQMSYAQILLAKYGPNLGDQGRAFAQHIVDAAERQGKLVIDLLAHTSVSRADLPMQAVSLAQAVELARSDLRPDVEQRQAMVQADVQDREVLANPSSLHLVILNLLSNALKFVPRGTSPQVRLWTEVCPGAEAAGEPPATAQQVVRLWVEDNGIGIPREHLDKLFGVFHRLHTSAEYPGTGIGLAIVKRAVERMGGRVGVESKVGEGSRFWVELRAA